MIYCEFEEQIVRLPRWCVSDQTRTPLAPALFLAPLHSPAMQARFVLNIIAFVSGALAILACLYALIKHRRLILFRRAEREAANPRIIIQQYQLLLTLVVAASTLYILDCAISFPVPALDGATTAPLSDALFRLVRSLQPLSSARASSYSQEAYSSILETMWLRLSLSVSLLATRLTPPFRLFSSSLTSHCLSHITRYCLDVPIHVFHDAVRPSDQAVTRSRNTEESEVGYRCHEPWVLDDVGNWSHVLDNFNSRRIFCARQNRHGGFRTVVRRSFRNDPLCLQLHCFGFRCSHYLGYQRFYLELCKPHDDSCKGSVEARYLSPLPSAASYRPCECPFILKFQPMVVRAT